MPKIAKELTALEVKRLSSPGFHAVGTVPGLMLKVSPTGAGRSWVLRIKVGDKRRDIGLGAYPGLSLANAHQKAREMREQVAQGVDPLAERQKATAALKATQAALRTFAQCVDEFMLAHGPTWRNAKHRQQWANTLSTYAYPKMGALAVQDITTPHVLAVLSPIWTTKTETATRLRGRIEQVLDFAKVQGLREGENPARWKGHLDKLLAKPGKVAKVEHHAALPYGRMNNLMQQLATVRGMGVLALEFAIYTAARSGEVRGARWSEVDMGAGVWVVPAERMKAGREHRVPLSEQALAVLERVPRLTEQENPQGYIFWGQGSGPLSDMSLSAVLKRLGLGGDVATVHGFRSTFRDWAAECTAYPREVAEAALAHINGDKVEAAYLRSDLFDKRRGLLQAWAKHCNTASASKSAGGAAGVAKVVPIGKAA